MSIFYRRLPKFGYIKPGTLDEAVSILNDHKGRAVAYAGGTDLIPGLKQRGMEIPEYIVDLKAVKGLDHILYDKDSGLRIGALATINSIEKSQIVKEKFPSLHQAASVMASPQIRNRGTLAGNICNAVPSADSAPALLTLEAELLIRGPGGERTVPIDRFFTGPRKTVLKYNEILVEIRIPESACARTGIYLKLSPRHSMDLAVVGVAALGKAERRICSEVKIALGAAAPTPVRALQAEAILKGKEISGELIEQAANAAVTCCSPIDDHRSSSEYRCNMIYIMTKRALRNVFSSQGDI